MNKVHSVQQFFELLVPSFFLSRRCEACFTTHMKLRFMMKKIGYHKSVSVTFISVWLPCIIFSLMAFMKGL